MKSNPWNKSRFDSQEEEPLGPLANFIDIMLVFACGLIAALVAMSPELMKQLTTPRVIEKKQELPDMPESFKGAGPGYEDVGRVYRDPKTGKLYLIGKTPGSSKAAY